MKKQMMATRPGITYKMEGFSLLGNKTIYTYQKLENGKWIEYDKETNKPTGRIF